jgi:hypothetical protein
MPASTKTGTYVPSQTQDCDAAVLMRRHLPGFLARLEESGHGPLPKFVQAELEGVGWCGDFTKGSWALGSLRWFQTGASLHEDVTRTSACAECGLGGRCIERATGRSTRDIGHPCP